MKKILPKKEKNYKHRTNSLLSCSRVNIIVDIFHDNCIVLLEFIEWMLDNLCLKYLFPSKTLKTPEIVGKMVSVSSWRVTYQKKWTRLKKYTKMKVLEKVDA